MAITDLVSSASKGDHDAFTRVTSGLVDRLFAVAYRILRDPDRAHDATQSALLGAWRDLPTLRDPDRFEAWLFRLLVNACYVEARGERRRAATQLRVLSMAQPAATAKDHAAGVADRDELERSFGALSPEQRAVIVLHHYVGYPLTEVAATLGIPEGTARSRLHYATRQLRAAIEADARPAAQPRGRTA